MRKADAAKVLMIIAPSNFRDEELLHTREALEEAGIAVVIASSATGEITGMLGAKVTPDIALHNAAAADYDAVVFVGGMGAKAYFNDRTAHKLALDAASHKKVVAAICIAPSILANAGILKGRRATSFPSEKANLEAGGATYTGEPLTVDGRIITADGPASARAFGRAIAQAVKSVH